MFNFSATWLAHETDDWTIRSGKVDHPLEQGFTRYYKCVRTFSSPMRRRPKHLFYAYSHLDLYTSRNVRVQLECTWDREKVEAEFSTWHDESKFFLVDGSYVAIL